MLFPATFISRSENIGVSLEKQAAILYLYYVFQFHPEMGSQVFLFWLLFQYEGIFSFLDYEILI